MTPAVPDIVSLFKSGRKEWRGIGVEGQFQAEMFPESLSDFCLQPTSQNCDTWPEESGPVGIKLLQPLTQKLPRHSKTEYDNQQCLPQLLHLLLTLKLDRCSHLSPCDKWETWGFIWEVCWSRWPSEYQGEPEHQSCSFRFQSPRPSGDTWRLSPALERAHLHTVWHSLPALSRLLKNPISCECERGNVGTSENYSIPFGSWGYRVLPDGGGG